MRFSQLLAALLVSDVFALPVSATPVTFQFEAEISQDAPAGFEDVLDLPFEFAIGDTITGRFLFEPFDAPAQTSETHIVQELPWTITVDGFLIAVDSYLFSVFDDLSGADAPIARDSIRLRAGGFCNTTDCLPLEIAGPESPEFFLRGNLEGAMNILSGADIPNDLVTWKSFDNFSLFLGMRDTSGLKFSGFRAQVTSMNMIPEPSSLTVLILCVLGATSARRDRIESRFTRS